MTTLLIVEAISVLFNIIFILLLIKEIKWCWIYGIVGSLTGAFVVYMNGYYSEGLLYVFYALMGIYGFFYWEKNSTKEFKIKNLPIVRLLILLVGGSIATLGLGYFMIKMKADKVYYDAFSTVFGVIATFLEIYKYLIAWYFWIGLNLFSIWLYQIKELNLLSIQMIIYTILSFKGLIDWHKKIKMTEISSS